MWDLIKSIAGWICAVIVILWILHDSCTPQKVAQQPQTFRGYDCLDDCSGHEAGYQWAEDNDIDDADDCTGNSQSFIEGCEAYVEDNY